MLDQQSAGIGHNNPPDDIETLKAKLAEDNKERLDRAKKLLAGVDNVPEKLEDEETAEKAAVFVAQLKKARKDAAGAWTTAKKPYTDAVNAVRSFFKDGLLTPLDAAANNVQAKIDERLRELDRIRQEQEAEERRQREEAERRATEEAERLAQEGKAFAAEQAQKQAEAIKKAAAKAERAATQNTAIKSAECGVSASARRPWDGEIEDISKVDLNLLRDHFTRAEIEKAVRSFVRGGGRELAGVHIYQTIKSTVRSK